MTIVNSLQLLTQDNGAIRELKELIKLEVFTNPELERYFTTILNAQDGKKIGWVGEMSNVGWDSEGCNPTYVTPTQEFAEKTWALGNYQVPLQWCYDDFLDTCAKYVLKKGTEIGDLTTTELMTEIIRPALERALEKMYWRIIWFADTAADTIANGGVLTNGTDPTLFTMTDGLWKRLFAVGTGDPTQVTAISANSQSTYATQKSTFLASGYATALVDTMLNDADARIRSLDGAGLFVTDKFAVGLAHDMKVTYHRQLTWDMLTNGIRVTQYDGVPVYSVPIWDRIINEFENSGTAWNLPYRAIFGAPAQLLVGTPADKIVSDLDIFFDRTTRSTHAFVEGRIGTQVGQDDLFQLAY